MLPAVKDDRPLEPVFDRTGGVCYRARRNQRSHGDFFQLPPGIRRNDDRGVVLLVLA